jgi:hypothetical protein
MRRRNIFDLFVIWRFLVRVMDREGVFGVGEELG